MVVTRCAWNVDKIKKALSLSRRQYVKLFTEILIASHWHVDEDERSTRNDNRDIDMECVHQLKHNAQWIQRILAFVWLCQMHKKSGPALSAVFGFNIYSAKFLAVQYSQPC